MGEGDKTLTEAKNLKVGKFCIIDDEACKVLSIDISKPGKHGSAKCRIVAVGLTDGRKREIVKPGDQTIGVPIIDKRTAQILAVTGDTVQLMDMQTFETFESKIPEELRGQLEQGKELTYWEVLGKKLLMG
ncbi:MAG: translation initiation factor IF-5A [Candidatus Aenigmatarchaeota archaeon]|nr:MAG: translation initiation factor IF-5A [Candidatus Aenigmarchaeota archaeon]